MVLAIEIIIYWSIRAFFEVDIHNEKKLMSFTGHVHPVETRLDLLNDLLNDLRKMLDNLHVVNTHYLFLGKWQ